jgi:cytochrome b561
MAISYLQWISRSVVEIELQGRLLHNYVCGTFRLIAGQHVALIIVHHVAQYDKLNGWPVMK